MQNRRGFVLFTAMLMPLFKQKNSQYVEKSIAHCMHFLHSQRTGSVVDSDGNFQDLRYAVNFYAIYCSSCVKFLA